MPDTFPPEISRFIEEEIASGHFKNETEVLAEALNVYRNLKQKHGELQEKVQQGLEDEKEGRVELFNIDDIIKRGQDRLAQKGLED